LDLLVLREIVLLDGNEPALVSLLLERCNGRQQLDITAELDERLNQVTGKKAVVDLPDKRLRE
jgi:hypothetical protein